MLKKISFIFVLIFIFIFSVPMLAYGADNSASSAIVIDCNTLEILYEKNIYEERAMASTTKIMTALLAIESGKLDETVEISGEMLDVIGSCLGLSAGDKLTIHDLVVGLLLVSGNDCANCLAFILAGSVESFAEMMNARAAEIGMSQTFFVTPSGLDEGNHHSTAYDMALLAAAALQNSTFVHICSMKTASVTVNDQVITVYNHNKLLSMRENCIGVKTGYTDKAGRCLVSAEKYNGNILICVTLNAPDDWDDHIRLFDECEKYYQKINVVGTFDINTAGGSKSTIQVGYDKTFYLIKNKISVKAYYYPFVYSPVKKGDVIGYAVIYNDGQILDQIDISAKEEFV